MRVQYRYTTQQMQDVLLIHIIAERENDRECMVKVYEAKDQADAEGLMKAGLEAMPFPHETHTKH